MTTTAEPRSCSACEHVDTADPLLGFHRARCGYHGGLEPGPIVALHKEPPRSCPLRAFSGPIDAAAVGCEPGKERLL